MMNWLLLAWIWPLLLALSYLPALIRPDSQSWAQPPARAALPTWRASLVVLGALPALAAALWVPVGTELSLPWLFLGTQLGLDDIGRVFLLVTAILWLAAGLYAAQSIREPERARRFHALYLLAMAGNLWLILGQDLFSFYAGFALMGLACYGLIIHDARTQALQAGRVYLVMTLIGEVCLFVAIILIAQQTGTEVPKAADLARLDTVAVAFIILGLGVKAGLVPLHLWLPTAYAAAPTPASAVLGGAMIKVALLGWLRFLPLGTSALPEAGTVIAVLGLISLFYALPIGLLQSDAKALLGYSSISKMGLAVLLLGLMLIEPSLAPAGMVALTLFAAHHALVKGGLFLGIGLRQDNAHKSWIAVAVLIGLAVLALAMASAPFTSGALTKYLMKPVLTESPWPWLPAALAVAAVATTLLMARFLWIALMSPASSRPQPRGWATLAWGVILLLVLIFPFALGKPSSWPTNSIPVAIGLGLAALVALAAWRNPAWLRPLIGLIPAGDLLVLMQPAQALLSRIGAGLQSPWLRLKDPVQEQAQRLFGRFFDTPLADPERRLRDWPVAGALWIGIITLLLLAMLAGSALVGGPSSGQTG
ncbi:complex I subunit 5 family protein [Lamprobacter modestohalophilus]|uniref:complex I subunit 5 family protein n=1 Tax=Lamprobacter modestohalophilus TaxID=1064514 RepID=UPI002ADED821|nr:complex I subunit 5 family protein [Lamprobacter modestohalophilus]MEA1051537.1 complex I subunit 5 family protein [Lamprobacter modestohalophilus]